jgi:hypothetical protein
VEMSRQGVIVCFDMVCGIFNDMYVVPVERCRVLYCVNTEKCISVKMKRVRKD